MDHTLAILLEFAISYTLSKIPLLQSWSFMPSAYSTFHNSAQPSIIFTMFAIPQVTRSSGHNTYSLLSYF